MLSGSPEKRKGKNRYSAVVWHTWAHPYPGRRRTRLAQPRLQSRANARLGCFSNTPYSRRDHDRNDRGSRGGRSPPACGRRPCFLPPTWPHVHAPSKNSNTASKRSQGCRGSALHRDYVKSWFVRFGDGVAGLEACRMRCVHAMRACHVRCLSRRLLFLALSNWGGGLHARLTCHLSQAKQAIRGPNTRCWRAIAEHVLSARYQTIV